MGEGLDRQDAARGRNDDGSMRADIIHDIDCGAVDITDYSLKRAQFTQDHSQLYNHHQPQDRRCDRTQRSTLHLYDPPSHFCRPQRGQAVYIAQELGMPSPTRHSRGRRHARSPDALAGPRKARPRRQNSGRSSMRSRLTTPSAGRSGKTRTCREERARLVLAGIHWPHDRRLTPVFRWASPRSARLPGRAGTFPIAIIGGVFPRRSAAT
jgi:hypothetical protein